MRTRPFGTEVGGSRPGAPVLHRLIPTTLLLTLVAPAALHAQEPAPPTRLDLEEAIARAHANNPAYRQEVNNLELNEIEGRDFWLGFLPDPSISLLNSNMQWNRTAVSTDFFGDPVQNPDFRMVQSASSSQSASLRFDLNLQDLFRRRADRLRAENRVALVGDRADELALDIRLSFLDAQERVEGLALEETLLEVRAAHYRLTERRFSLALADRVDLVEAELDLVNQENELERSRAGLLTFQLQLRNRIGDPTLGEVELVPTILRIFDPASLDIEGMVAAALQDGPRVRQAGYAVRESRENVSLQRAQWMPTLSLLASTGRQQFSRDSGDGFFRPLPDGEWSRLISLTVSFPNLGTYFTRQNDGRRTDLEIRNAQEALRATRLSVEEEVRGLHVELVSQYRTLVLQERRAALAGERLELQEEYYRLGQIDYDALQSSAEASANAERQVLQARYAFERALIQLERALGTPIRASEAR